MKNKKKKNYFLFLLFSFSFASDIAPLENYVGNGNEWYIFYSKKYIDFEKISKNDWKKTVRTNNPDKPNDYHHIWYRKKIIGADRFKVPAIFVDIRRLTKIYIDGKEIYQFGSSENKFFPGWEWAFLSISNKKEQEITIYQYSPTKNIGFHTFRFGEKISILNNLSSVEMSRFMIGYFITLSGLIVLFFALIFNRDKLLLYFSGFSIVAGLYHISTVHALGYLWFPNKYFWPYLMYASMYYIPVFLLPYFELIIGKGKFQITRIFVWAHILYANIALLLIALRIVHMEDTMGYAQSFLLVTTTVHLYRMFSLLLRQREIEILILSSGVIIFLIFSGVDLIFARLTASPINNISHFSILIFDLFLVFIIIRRFRLMQLKLKNYSESLEEKISERTKELKEIIIKLENDVDRARIIQQKLLPDNKSIIPGIVIDYIFRPMSQVGGDFIDFHIINKNKIRIMLADATGHGIQAALLTMALKTDYEALKREDIALNEIMERLNSSFHQKYESLNSFFTAVLIDIDLSQNTYYIVSAGHPVQYYISDTFFEEIEKTGPLVGIKPEVNYKVIPGIIYSNSTMVLTTDGLLEQENKNGHNFQETNFFSLLKSASSYKKDFIQVIEKEFIRFHKSVPQYDDVTVIAIYFE